jgi:FlaA1/EpsC-like NDP-sugar epimerase
MGLTKRVAELMVLALSQSSSSSASSAATSNQGAPESTLTSSSATEAESERGAAAAESHTVLCAVRFGNVLGSRGSVVPTLLRQIEAGGPITITHPEAQRFFMTISEAASLVLLSAAYGEPGGLFVLDMGDEVRIEDLAERLVRLKGLRPGRDVAVHYIGLRPGEKLREELHTEDERLLATDRQGVWRVQGDDTVDGDALLEGVRDLDARRRTGGLEPSAYPSLLRELIARTTGRTDAIAAAR